MTERTARLALPLLVAGQGQKDVTHNEALLMLDALVQLSLEDWQLLAPPAEPVAGQCWIVPTGATGAWTGREGAIAHWTEGGWRFLTPRDGMSGWLRPLSRRVRWTPSGWAPETPAQVMEPSITAPVGGGVVDVEARAALSAVLNALSRLGLVGA